MDPLIIQAATKAVTLDNQQDYAGAVEGYDIALALLRADANAEQPTYAAKISEYESRVAVLRAALAPQPPPDPAAQHASFVCSDRLMQRSATNVVPSPLQPAGVVTPLTTHWPSDPCETSTSEAVAASGLQRSK